jgi:ethanolamine utilization protein EutQ (cupin superfamily)
VNEDESPEAKLGALGFTRAAAGASSQFEFAYDEVLVVTRGRCAIHCWGEQSTAGPGEVLYLPAGVPGEIYADEDVEIVYVASSPYGEVNREAKAALLAVKSS